MYYKDRDGHQLDFWELGSSEHVRQLWVEFLFETGPNMPREAAKRVAAPDWERGRFADICIVRSEDAEDNDLNDTELYINCIKNPNAGPA